MTLHDPNDPDFLTGPERAAARSQAIAGRDVANKCGGCFCCHSRNKFTESVQWGLAECGLKPPAKFKKHRCTFQPDYKRLYPGKHENHLDKDKS